MDQIKSTERRQRAHVRYKTELSAEIHTGRQTVTACAKNLSLGGVGLELEQALDEGLAVLVHLFLVEDGIEDETSGSLELQGQIVWVAPVDRGGYEGGVRFTALSPKQVQHLERILTQLAR